MFPNIEHWEWASIINLPQTEQRETQQQKILSWKKKNSTVEGERQDLP